ncbi:hypothetical protein KAH27_07465 [bacterium]|nr:hypothetical protein [bacterium]
MKITHIFLISLLIFSSIGYGVDLIDTSFEDSDGWANHSTGDWTEDADDGTWTGHGIYANTSDARTGSRKVGFNTVGDWLEFPTTNNPGVLTLWARLSSADTSGNKMKVQRYNGSSWVDVEEFSDTTTTYTEHSININLSENNVRLRLYRSADDKSHYIDDVVLTKLSDKPSVTTSNIVSITDSGAIGGGTIIATNGGPILARGI